MSAAASAETRPPALRLARPEDRAAVERVVMEAYAHYVPRLGRKPGPMLDDYAARIAEGRVHVLETEAGIGAVLVLIPQPGALLLDNIAVAPEAQGRGLGRLLLDFVDQAAREAGFPAIRLYTNALMTENIALYTRLGFRETRRATEKGLHRVYMEKAPR